MKKLYCYVDESGQDTSGKLFLVSVILASGERETLRDFLSKIEKTSGKGIKKWMKSTQKQKHDYLEALFQHNAFEEKIYYSEYHDTRAYVDLIILSAAKSIHGANELFSETVIFVDGLKRSERHHFAAGIRKLNIRVRKVRGIKDEADEFIRLADAICGFMRDVLEEKFEMATLYQKGARARIIKKV
jgi:hypothetical protein